RKGSPFMRTRTPITIACVRKTLGATAILAGAIGVALMLVATATALSSGLRSRIPMTKSAETQQAVYMLEPGRSVTQELRIGQCHSYEVEAAAGQYVQVLVDPAGVDLTVRLIDPTGNVVVRLNRWSTPWRRKPLSFIAMESGVHRIEIRSTEKGVR